MGKESLKAEQPDTWQASWQERQVQEGIKTAKRIAKRELDLRNLLVAIEPEFYHELKEDANTGVAPSNPSPIPVPRLDLAASIRRLNIKEILPPGMSVDEAIASLNEARESFRRAAEKHRSQIDKIIASTAKDTRSHRDGMKERVVETVEGSLKEAAAERNHEKKQSTVSSADNDLTTGCLSCGCLLIMAALFLSCAGGGLYMVKKKFSQKGELPEIPPTLKADPLLLSQLHQEMETIAANPKELWQNGRSL